MSTTMTQDGQKQSGELSQAENTYQSTFVPRFDIWETEDELILHGDMPGVKPENIDIQFEHRELNVHGKVCPRHSNVKTMYREYEIGDFHRTFAIGEAIDAAKISAEMENGVLTLHLPKSESIKPRRIQVTAK